MIEQQQELIEALEQIRKKLEDGKQSSIEARVAINMLLKEIKNRDLSAKRVNKLWKKYYILEKEINKVLGN